jgi:hypothetical protein
MTTSIAADMCDELSVCADLARHRARQFAEKRDPTESAYWETFARTWTEYARHRADAEGHCLGCGNGEPAPCLDLEFEHRLALCLFPR